MAIDRKELSNVFKKRCQEVDTLFGGYNNELYKSVIDIIHYENQHLERHTNIQKKVNDICGALGELVIKNYKDED